MPVNVRSPRQWEILSAAYDFQGKRVLDVGCGHADLLYFAQRAGAKVLGIERNTGINQPVPVIHADLVEYLRSSDGFDAAICFSVLPYLPDPEEAMLHLAYVADVTFIECQYKGDGPGMIADDAEMLALLQRFWLDVQKIGYTTVAIRNVQRSIWMCRQKGES